MSPSGFGGNPAGFFDERGEISFTVPGVTPDGGPMEGAPFLEPIEHSVLEKPLDGGPKEWMPVLEALEHSVPAITLDDGPMGGRQFWSR